MSRIAILWKALPIFAGALLFCVPSCHKTPAPGKVTPDTDSIPTIQNVRDSLTVKVKSRGKILTLDLLVYGGAPLLSLESCHRFTGDSLCIALKDSLSKTLVVLGNMPGQINQAAIQHFDSLQGLEMSLWDDNPQYPFMSGIAEHKGGSAELELEIQALMSCVLIRSITNLNDDYTLLENISFRLSGMNAKAQLMRWSGFSCSEPVEGQKSPKTFDVGLYTLYPELRLWCYPCDQASATPQLLVVEYCKQNAEGDLQVRQVALETGPIARNSELAMDIYLK